MCSLLLPWQASPTGKVRSKTVKTVNTGQAAHLSDLEGAVGELGGDAS